jgi:hypothetical protein
MPDTTPIEGDPFESPTTVPVFHDPFSAPDAPTTPEQTARFRQMLSALFRNTVGAPGTVMRPVVSQNPGQWSDEDEARRLATEGTAFNWGPQQALGMIAPSSPFAEVGAVGSAGGKLKRAVLQPVEYDPFEGTNKSMTDVVYHGTDKSFDKFDLSKGGTGGWQNVPVGEKQAQFAGDAAYFTSSERHAKMYGENVVAAKLSIKNPVHIDADNIIRDWHKETQQQLPPDERKPFDKWLASHDNVYTALSADELFTSEIAKAKKMGHDGLVVDFGQLPVDGRAGSPKAGKVYVVFHGDQIHRPDAIPVEQ